MGRKHTNLFNVSGPQQRWRMLRRALPFGCCRMVLVGGLLLERQLFCDVGIKHESRDCYSCHALEHVECGTKGLFDVSADLAEKKSRS